MLLILLASFGAAVGSVFRFLVQTKVTSNAARTIVVINWCAAMLAGMIFALPLSRELNTLLMAGFVGGFSTFSGPIIVLADAMKQASERWRAIWDMIVLFAGGILFFWLGYYLGSFIIL